jgi:hypothetical protein
MNTAKSRVAVSRYKWIFKSQTTAETLCARRKIVRTNTFAKKPGTAGFVSHPPDISRSHRKACTRRALNYACGW